MNINFCDWFTNNTSLTHLDDITTNQIVHISCIGNALKTNKDVTDIGNDIIKKMLLKKK